MIKSKTFVSAKDIKNVDVGNISVESTEEGFRVLLHAGGFPLYVDGEELIRAVQNALNVPST